MAGRGKMCSRLVFTGLCVASVQAFIPSGIQWAPAHDTHSFVAPETNAAPPAKPDLSEFTRITPPSETLHSEIPHFSVNPDKTITWEGLCLEASGHQVGEMINAHHCTRQPSQLWNVLTSGSEYQKMIQLQNTNMCIAYNGKRSGLIPFVLQECALSVSDTWKFKAGGLPQSTSDLSEHPATSTIRHVMISSLLLAVLGALVGILHLRSMLRRTQKDIGAVTKSQSGLPWGLDEGGVSMVSPLASPNKIPVVMALGPEDGEEEPIDYSVLEVGRRSIFNPPECLSPLRVPGSEMFRNEHLQRSV
jgi:hypothetical protein